MAPSTQGLEFAARSESSERRCETWRSLLLRLPRQSRQSNQTIPTVRGTLQHTPTHSPSCVSPRAYIYIYIYLYVRGLSLM
uniref:Uncharacterized protein n=1 Tax=Trichogramma kaykai TaxID=54128 RepID=A0ABD2XG06_9HYME